MNQKTMLLASPGGCMNPVNGNRLTMPGILQRQKPRNRAVLIIGFNRAVNVIRVNAAVLSDRHRREHDAPKDRSATSLINKHVVVIASENFLTTLAMRHHGAEVCLRAT